MSELNASTIFAVVVLGIVGCWFYYKIVFPKMNITLPMAEVIPNLPEKADEKISVIEENEEINDEANISLPELNTPADNDLPTILAQTTDLLTEAKLEQQELKLDYEKQLEKIEQLRKAKT